MNRREHLQFPQFHMLKPSIIYWILRRTPKTSLNDLERIVLTKSAVQATLSEPDNPSRRTNIVLYANNRMLTTLIAAERSQLADFHREDRHDTPSEFCLSVPGDHYAPEMVSTLRDSN